MNPPMRIALLTLLVLTSSCAAFMNAPIPMTSVKHDFPSG